MDDTESMQSYLKLHPGDVVELLTVKKYGLLKEKTKSSPDQVAGGYYFVEGTTAPVWFAYNEISPVPPFAATYLRDHGMLSMF